MRTSNVDLVSKLVVFFTLRAVAPQTDVLIGKPRDFRAFQSSLGLPIEPLNLFSKNLFSYMRLIFALYIELFYIFLCQCEAMIASMWSMMVELLQVTRVGTSINCLRPNIVQNL